MRKASIFIFAILVGLIGSTIQAGELINYQGRLTDSEGNPVADDTYQLTFSLYDDSTGGFLQWSEVHPSVQSEDGLYCVMLGSLTDLDASIFETEPLYLEIQVGVEVISPRTRLTSAPSAIKAKNMSGGDIETGPSSLVVKSATGDTGIVMGAVPGKSSVMQLVLNNLEGDPIGPMLEMTSNPFASSGVLIHAAEPLDEPRIAINAHRSDSSEIVMYRPGAVPHDEKIALGMRTGSNGTFFDVFADDGMGRLFEISGNHNTYEANIRFLHPPEKEVLAISSAPSTGASIYMATPLPEPPRVLEMSVNESAGEWGGYFDMYSIDPTDDGAKIFEISNTASSGASVKMFNPVPEPPATLMEMSVNESAGEWGSYFNMHSIDPADEKVFEISNTASSGVSIKMMDPSDEHPVIQMNTGAGRTIGGSIKMFNPQPEPPAVYFDLNATPTAGASMNIYDDIGKVMGTEGSPFNSGHSIKLFNPVPEPPAVVAEMAGSYDGKGGTGQVAVYDDANHLQSSLTPAKLLLNYAFGDNFGPPVSLEASASQAKVGIGTYTPSEPLVIGNDLGTLGGDWIVIGNSEVGEMSGFVAGEDLDSCGWMSWVNNDNCLVLGAQGVDIVYLKDGKVGIGTNGPTEELHVVGDICYTGSIGACSDRRYKKDIQTIGHAVGTLLKLRGVSYSWRHDEYPDMKFDDQTHLGFVAQEIKDLVPGAVLVDDKGKMSVDYGRITPLLVEAFKEQQGQIKELNAQIADLREALGKLQAMNR